MRKVWVILLALMLVVPSAYAEETLADRAVALVQTCDALAGDENYCNAMTATGGTVGELLQTWADGEHSQPRLILHADTSKLVDNMKELYGDDDAQSLSETAMTELRRKYPASLASMMNATAGAETLVAATIATTNTIFASDVQGSGMFILLYGHAVPAVVTWYAENGAVSMQASFLALDTLNDCQTAEDVSAVLAEQGWTLTLETMTK